MKSVIRVLALSASFVRAGRFRLCADDRRTDAGPLVESDRIGPRLRDRSAGRHDDRDDLRLRAVGRSDLVSLVGHRTITRPATFTSAYDIFANGQCFGCPYVAPTHTGDAGPITITFHTNQTATLTYPGGSTDIVKFQYGFPDRTQVLYGEWALTYETGGNVGGDWVVLDTPYTDPASGTAFVSGHAAATRRATVLGIYDPNFAEAQIEVTDGTTKRLYRFGVFDDRRLLGTDDATTGTTSVGPYVASGARLLYKSELATTSIGPGRRRPRCRRCRLPDAADTAAVIGASSSAPAKRRD